MKHPIASPAIEMALARINTPTERAIFTRITKGILKAICKGMIGEYNSMVTENHVREVIKLNDITISIKIPGNSVGAEALEKIGYYLNHLGYELAFKIINSHPDKLKSLNTDVLVYDTHTLEFQVWDGDGEKIASLKPNKKGICKAPLKIRFL